MCDIRSCSSHAVLLRLSREGRSIILLTYVGNVTIIESSGMERLKGNDSLPMCDIGGHRPPFIHLEVIRRGIIGDV